MNFRDIGFKRFINHYAENHVLENALRDAYNAGYEDGWRDKQAKNIRESPQNILFVFEESYDCYFILKEALTPFIVHTTSNEIIMNDGSELHIYSPKQIHIGVLHGKNINIAYIEARVGLTVDKKRELEQEVFTYLEPMNGRISYLTFDEFKSLDFENLWKGTISSREYT